MFCMTAWLMLQTTEVAAIAPPDAGTTLQQLPQAPDWIPRPPPPLQEPQQGTPQQPVMQPMGQNIEFQVGALHISGATLFSEQQLLELVSDAVGHQSTLAQLNAYSARITAFYRDRGYMLARAYFPEQNFLEGGSIEIAVVEGRYGAIELQNHSSLRSEIAQAALIEIKSGAVVAQKALDRALLLLNDTPGATAKGTLTPGVAPGTTDLTVALTALPTVGGNVAIDDHGSRYTGQVRASGTLNLNNPSGYGDLASLRLFTSAAGLDYGYLGWISPASAHGTRFGASYADTHYRLGREFAVLDAHGDASIASVHLSNPFLRSRTVNLYGQAGYDRKRLQDRIDAIGTVASKHADVGWLGLSGTTEDGAGGYNTFSTIVSRGSMRPQEAAILARDQGTARTSGSYGKLTFDLARQQILTGQLLYHVSLSGQFASKNLDSSEKFDLGGANGVRAYPQGEAPSDEAVLLTLELRYSPTWLHPIPGTVQLVGFVDTAHARPNKHPWAELTGDAQRTLSGAGIGIRIGKINRFSAIANYAFKISGEGATAEPDRSGRFWLQIAQYF